jgi:ribosomal protein S18 acetylase RimI-like enzyme
MAKSMIDLRSGRNMELRRATPDDAPVLARVHVDSWQAAYRGIVPDDFLQGFTYQRREQAFRKAIEAGMEETYLAEETGQAVGILTIGPGRDDDLDLKTCGELWGIYLSPAWWRHGIGKQMFLEAERMLCSRGYRKIVLWVLEGNLSARSFYEAMGFRLDGASRVANLGKPLNVVRYARDYPAK